MDVMWYEMRQHVIEHFPSERRRIIDVDKYLVSVEEHFTSDAYNSLSIEGYQVSPELIEKVSSGQRNPDGLEEDRNQRNALAARG